MPSSGEKEVYSTKLHSRVGIIPKVQLPGDINVKSTIIIPGLYAGLARGGSSLPIRLTDLICRVLSGLHIYTLGSSTFGIERSPLERSHPWTASLSTCVP